MTRFRSLSWIDANEFLSRHACQYARHFCIARLLFACHCPSKMRHRTPCKKKRKKKKKCAMGLLGSAKKMHLQFFHLIKRNRRFSLMPAGHPIMAFHSGQHCKHGTGGKGAAGTDTAGQPSAMHAAAGWMRVASGSGGHEQVAAARACSHTPFGCTVGQAGGAHLVHARGW